MKFLQRALTSLVPSRVAEQMRRETDQWQVRCGGCGKTKSLWEAGGIRYGKSSTRNVSATLAWCRECGGLRLAMVERRAKFPSEVAAAKPGEGRGS